MLELERLGRGEKAVLVPGELPSSCDERTVERQV